MIPLEIKNSISIKGVRGFTLIEILVVMAIVGMMMSAIYAVHIANIRAISVEAERVEIQQDQRISVDFVTRQLRMAGYDREDSLLPKIEDARSNFIYYTADFNADGDVDDANEHVAFCIYNSADFGLALSYITGNSNTIGAVTSAANPLPIAHTHPPHVHQAFAPIENIEFFYTLANGATTTCPTTAELEEIRAIDVTILTRADTPDPRWIDNVEYVPSSLIAPAVNICPTASVPWGPYEDNIRRRMMTANVRLRNMGL